MTARVKKRRVTARVAGPSDAQMSLVEHLVELKKRVLIVLSAWLVATIACYYYAEPIYQFLVQPLAHVYEGQAERRLIYTGLTEAFFTYLQLAMFAGFVVAFPIFAFQLYFFLAPGLYKHERAFLLPVLFLSPVLFLMGAALVYFFVFPVAWKFFAGFETMGTAGLPIQLEARVSEYLALVTSLMLAFGLAFQMPVALMLLAKVGVVTPKLLRKFRRYAIVIIFIIAGILTPPDVISQIGLAIPLLILYEFSIFLCGYVQTSKK